LIVDRDSVEILQNLSYLSKIYPIVQSIYSDVTSLYISSNSFKDLIKSGKIEVYSIEDNK